MLHIRSTLSVMLAFCMATAGLTPVLARDHSGSHRSDGQPIDLGPRPLNLVDDMDPGPLKDALKKCSEGPFKPNDFSIGHRGAALQYPEHTLESYEAAARMGAGIIECDVTFAQQMIDEYKAAGVTPEQVFVQSFDLNDVLYWIDQEPEFGKQAVYLDAIESVSEGYPSRSALQALAAQGVNIIAPPLWALLDIGTDSRIVPSSYALDARAAGLDIVTWTLERSGPLESGGGWYHQSVTPAIDNDGDIYEVLDVLAQDVGIIGIFSDWPATVTYYANCKGL